MNNITNNITKINNVGNSGLRLRQSLLCCLRNVNCLPLWVIKPVHGVNAGQHGESPETDKSEAETDEDADPDPNREEIPALPLRSKLSTSDLEDLHPPVREVDLPDLAADGAVGVDRPEPARGGAGVAQTYWSVYSVSLYCSATHVQLIEGAVNQRFYLHASHL